MSSSSLILIVSLLAVRFAELLSKNNSKCSFVLALRNADFICDFEVFSFLMIETLRPKERISFSKRGK